MPDPAEQSAGLPPVAEQSAGLSPVAEHSAAAGIGADVPLPASPGTARQALDDALYYLRDGCVPCAERQFAKARRFGATGEMIAAVRRVAARPTDGRTTEGGG